MKFTLFTSPTCPRCPQAKDILIDTVEKMQKAGSDVIYEIIDIATDDGYMRAIEMNVMHVPRIVLNESTDIDTHIPFERIHSLHELIVPAV